MIKAKYKVGDRVIRAQRILFHEDTDEEQIIPPKECIVKEAHTDSVLAKNFGEATYQLEYLDDEIDWYVSESDITLNKKYYREQSLKKIL